MNAPQNAGYSFEPLKGKKSLATNLTILVVCTAVLGRGFNIGTDLKGVAI